MLEIGSYVDGKYKILNKIGQGGMSVVYLAMNERANKQWAIKEVRKDGVKDYEVVRQGLIAETDILKNLNHPHLPSIIDVIDRDDTFLIVMDYIEGKDLDYWLKTEGAQPQERVVDWAMQICDVLGYLHSRKPPIIYRDLKPANVMLQPDGQIMIIDFGTAREFKETSVEDTSCLGTQGYAAPEQYGGHGQTDARTDIYTLGATMYHLLTGHNPSKPPYEMYPIRKWNPQLSSGLEKIVLKCTQRDPANRYQNCAELMYALQHYTELDSTYRKKQKRKWFAFLATSAAAVISLGGCIGFRVAANQATASTYESLIEQAEKESDEDEKLALYEEAISVDPGESEAYLELLDHYVASDLSFDSSEYSNLRAVLTSKKSGSSTTNQAAFKSQSEEEYIEFCYKMGVYLYYYYEGDNHSVCLTWFSEVIDSADDAISDDKREIANRLWRIESYAASLTTEKKDISGLDSSDSDTYSSYEDYWNDLVEVMADLDTVTNSDSDDDVIDKATAVTIYKEFLAVVQSNVNDFKSAGVGQTTIETQIAEAESGLTALQNLGVTNYSDSDWEDLFDMVGYAEDAVYRAYQGTGASQAAGGTDDE